MDLGELYVRRLIIHEVPKPADGPVGLSEIESPLKDEIGLYFRERLVESFVFDRTTILFDPASDSPVPAEVLTLLTEAEPDLLGRSQALAKHLHDRQTGATSGGLLMVALLEVSGSRGVGILKLEKEEGAHALLKTVGGKHTIDVELIKDLFLTKKTRVFKAAIFVSAISQKAPTKPSTETAIADEALGPDVDSKTGEAGISPATGMEAVVADRQVERTPSAEVAQFFMKFLGCKIASDPKTQTTSMVEESLAYINEIPDPTKKSRYLTGLVADVAKPAETINVSTFAEDNLDEDDRDSFVQHLANKGVPTTSFQKDITSVKSFLEKITYKFESGINVIVPTAAEGDVAVGGANDHTVLTVTGKLKKVR